MKFAILVLSLVFSAQANAADFLNCTATQVTGGPFAESFTVEEYPNFSINEEEVWFGSSSYEVSEGHSITLTETPTQLKATVIDASGEERFEIVVRKNTKKGYIKYHTTNEWETEEVARIVCR